MDNLRLSAVRRRERDFGDPSLHVTIGVRIALAIHVFARWLTIPATLFAAMIFLMSIALGWHYAVDGIVGAAAALACYFALLPSFRGATGSSLRTTGA